MIFLLDKHKNPIKMCHPAEARALLKAGKATIHKRHPFSIRLKDDSSYDKKEYTLKFDPGARTTGVAILESDGNCPKVVFLANLEHRQDIKGLLTTRRMFRNNRRTRNTRYRKPRFLNRTRPVGWLPPSVLSIVNNIDSWTARLLKLCNITSIKVETVRFDVQLMENPNIEGVEYQKGELFGYEIKEYLLFKYGHKCQYCQGESNDEVLNIEHMISKSNGGSNRLRNLTLSCVKCNSDKGSLNLDQWLENLKVEPKTKLNKMRIANIENILQNGISKGYADTAKVNTTRNVVKKILFGYTANLEVSSGGKTKYNRTKILKLPKTHYYDALCVGDIPKKVFIPNHVKVLHIKSIGRGTRRRTKVNKYGFPQSYMPDRKMLFNFISGDYAKAVIPEGQYKGTYFGVISCRSRGQFDITTKEGKRISANYKYFTLLQRADGYRYGEGNPL